MGPYRTTGTPTPDVLICSGLDPSGGAGFIADVRIVHELGARPVGAITAMTVQNTEGMRACHEVDAAVFGAQLNTLLIDVQVRAVKLGIVGAHDILEELDHHLALTDAPVVWDPVAAPTQGNVRFDPVLFERALDKLGRHLTLITPNADELRMLCRRPVDTLADAIDAAGVLARGLSCAILVKGGHFVADDAVDVLVTGDRVAHLRGERVPGEDVHGTGCALSSAIATYLALGHELLEACTQAKAFVAARIAAPARPGRGAPAVV